MELNKKRKYNEVFTDTVDTVHIHKRKKIDTTACQIYIPNEIVKKVSNEDLQTRYRISYEEKQYMIQQYIQGII